MNKFVIVMMTAIAVTGCSESQSSANLEISKATCTAASKWIDDQVADIAASRIQTPVEALERLPEDIRKVNSILVRPASDIFERVTDIRHDPKSEGILQLVSSAKTSVEGSCANLIGKTGSEDFGKANICIAMRQVKLEEMQRRAADPKRSLLDATGDLTDFQKKNKEYSIVALEDVYKTPIPVGESEMARFKGEDQWMPDLSCLQTTAM